METPAQDYYYRSVVSTEKRLSMDLKQEPFVVEEFLDFSNDEENVDIMPDVKSPLSLGFNKDFYNAGSTGGLNSAESSSVTAVDSCYSSERHLSIADGSFTGELCVPYEDLAELEWLSTITEESFSSEDMQKLQLISGMTARLDGSRVEANKSDLSLCNEMPVPGKARSKRSRTTPGKWASRFLVLSPRNSSSEADHPFPTTGGKSLKAVMKKKEGLESGPGDGRRCLHCATDKTPQWRTGPMGPKTLCNACGVRYKSGRLVPEYRPAASPTFVQTKHSNSHRKVLELRRQKEMHRPHHLDSHRHPQQFLQHHPNMIYDLPNGEDYLIHQHMGPDFRQLI